MSELFDKQVNAQQEKSSGVYASSCKPTKCAMKMKEMKETNKQKKHCKHKNVIDGKKQFISCTRRNGKNDLNELQVNDSGHSEGSYYLFSKQINGCQRDERGSMNRYH